jgi:hypothetical protein
MESRYSVRWAPRSGGSVAIEAMTDRELMAARYVLEREDPVDPVATTLLQAVSAELRRRTESATLDEAPPDEWREAA